MAGDASEELAVIELATRCLGDIITARAIEALRLAAHCSDIPVREAIFALREGRDFRITTPHRAIRFALPFACGLVQARPGAAEQTQHEAQRPRPERAPHLREEHHPQKIDSRHDAEHAHDSSLPPALRLR